MRVMGESQVDTAERIWLLAFLRKLAHASWIVFIEG
jgi:hypothetical protein